MVTRLRVGLRWLLLMATLMAVTTVPVAATTLPMASSTGGPTWATYVDPRFDFALEYPASWEVVPRDDTPGHVGGPLGFRERKSDTNQRSGDLRKVDVGFYLVEYQPSVPLDEWSSRYNARRSLPGWPQPRVSRTLAGRVGADVSFREEGASVLTPYTMVNIVHGNMVWFVWTNTNDAQELGIFEHMLQSLHFGDRAPATLQQAYGVSFKPDALERAKPLTRSSGVVTIQAMSDYRVPVAVHTTILCGDDNAEVCGGTHQGSERYAIDIQVGTGTTVYNTIASWVWDYGYVADGRGLWLSMWDYPGNNLAHYFHLSSVDWERIDYWQNQSKQVPRSETIAFSGDTGMGGAHLHYHVQDTAGAAIQLNGMVGLSLSANYPNCAADPSVCLPEHCGADVFCTCGYVN